MDTTLYILYIYMYMQYMYIYMQYIYIFNVYVSDRKSSNSSKRLEGASLKWLQPVPLET